jgi:hypothetical protein
MKQFIYILSFSIIAACAPEENTPTKPINDDFDPTKATLLRAGLLMGCGGHTVMGVAEIYDDNGKLVLLFDDFTSQNGPDLYVYLSTTSNANQFVSLGKLKSTTGKQTYEIPDGTDVMQYKYAHVWCKQFSVCFGLAQTN